MKRLDQSQYRSPGTRAEIENLLKNGGLYVHNCHVCGGAFEHFKKNAAYCSQKCRGRRHYERLKAKRPAKISEIDIVRGDLESVRLDLTIAREQLRNLRAENKRLRAAMVGK